MLTGMHARQKGQASPGLGVLAAEASFEFEDCRTLLSHIDVDNGFFGFLGYQQDRTEVGWYPGGRNLGSCGFQARRFRRQVRAETAEISVVRGWDTAEIVVGFGSNRSN